MADFNWCHGPQCHEKHTVDRVRGVKGSKVLRTRKIKINSNGWPSGQWQYFCSQRCYDDFAHKHIQNILALEPRTEALETPIEDPKKTTTVTEYGYTYTNTEIKDDETRQID